MAGPHGVARRSQRTQMEWAAPQRHSGHQRSPSRFDWPLASVRPGRGGHYCHTHPRLGKGRIRRALELDCPGRASN
eukprot:6932353-Alexandrium_andersonii.AAC.1